MPLPNWLGEVLAPLGRIFEERERRHTRRVETQAQAQERADNRDAANDAARNELDAAQERNQAEIEQTQTLAERDWDVRAAEAATSSWKDEYWTLVFGTILIVAFIPGGAGFVQAGFQAINFAPAWFQAGLLASWSYSFGIRHVFNFVRGRWGSR